MQEFSCVAAHGFVSTSVKGRLIFLLIDVTKMGLLHQLHPFPPDWLFSITAESSEISSLTKEVNGGTTQDI